MAAPGNDPLFVSYGSRGRCVTRHNPHGLETVHLGFAASEMHGRRPKKGQPLTITKSSFSHHIES